MIAVPYRSQEDPDAGRYRNDCGAACVGMLLDWQGVHLTTNALAAQTTLAQHDDGLTCWQLAALLNKNGVPARVRTLHLADLRAELDAGRPVILLVWYGHIPNRQATFSGGHFFVVVGYDEDSFYVNDPDWWGARRNEGNGFRVPAAALDNALRYSEVPYQCVVVQ